MAEIRKTTASGGYDGNDTIIGNEGGDIVYGGLGNDSYVFTPRYGVAYGSDAVIEQLSEGTDTIVLHGVDPGDVHMWTSSYGNLFIAYSEYDSLTVYGGLDGYGANNVGAYVESTAIDDTTVWDLTAGLHLIADDNGRYLYGTSYADILEGGADNDYALGYGGDDIILSNGGYDYFMGGDGNDTIILGVGGSSTIYGDADADTFKFIDIASNDAICDFSTTQGDIIDLSEILTAYDQCTIRCPIS